MKKKLFISIVGTSILAVSVAVGAYAATKFTIVVNGKVANTEAKVINGVTYLPLRDIGTLLGADVQYEASTQTVKVTSKTTSNTTSVTTAPSQPTNTNTIGLSRSKPAPLGTPVTIDIDNGYELYTGEVTLEEVIRGEKAWDMIAKENQFSDPAPEGYEYLLAKINVKVTRNMKKDTTINISDYDFKLVSGDGKDYNRSGIVVPSPKLDAALYEGAADDGYTSFIVKTDDKNPLITFGRDYDGSGGVWLKP